MKGAKVRKRVISEGCIGAKVRRMVISERYTGDH